MGMVKNVRNSSLPIEKKTYSSTYIGQYIHSVDPKNRLFLPARFRHTKTYILTRGLESCLYLYDPEGWEKVLQKLEDLTLPDKMQERAFKSALLSGAHEVSTDIQGRILVPQTLKEYAGIDEEVIIIGVGNRLEIWDKKRWDTYYKKEADVSFRDLAGKLEI